MSETNVKELIEGLIQDYTKSIEKGQEHINLLDIENRILSEHAENLNDKKKAETQEMITFNNHQKELILEDMVEKNEKLFVISGR